MIVAAASGVPVGLATALVAITALGATIQAVAAALNGIVQLRRLQSLDAQRTIREEARHAELLAAVKDRKS